MRDKETNSGIEIQRGKIEREREREGERGGREREGGESEREREGMRVREIERERLQCEEKCKNYSCSVLGQLFS